MGPGRFETVGPNLSRVGGFLFAEVTLAALIGMPSGKSDPGVEADLVLSSFMRLLPRTVVDALPPHLINIHPAHLPEFPDVHGVRDPLAARVDTTGGSYHRCRRQCRPGSRHRAGTRSCPAGPVLQGDNELELHARTNPAKRRRLPLTFGCSMAESARSAVWLNTSATAYATALVHMDKEKQADQGAAYVLGAHILSPTYHGCGPVGV